MAASSRKRHEAAARDAASVPRITRTLTPRDAATLILVDRSGHEPRILMGRRRASEVFLPNKFVFPGGRLDRGDWTATAHDTMSERDVQRLMWDMKGRASPERARALALAAIRETFEEAGLVIGRPSASQGVPTSRHPTWRRFYRSGYLPAISRLSFLARAITPPARPRRYDTRFFVADATEVAQESTRPDDELNTIGWFTIAEIQTLDLPNITRAVMEDLVVHLARGDTAAPVPFYSFRNGAFRRDLIA